MSKYVPMVQISRIQCLATTTNTTNITTATQNKEKQIHDL
jgi:hypothetical protein